MIKTNRNNEDIYEDFDIYKNIRKDSNISSSQVLDEIYLKKIKINELNFNIKKNINKISKLKIEVIEYISQWKLEDSCNKIKLKNTVKNIKKYHEIITHLEYLNEDLSNDIKSIINNIENIKQENIKQKNIKQENIKQENIKQENIKQKNIKQENIKQENIKHENIKQENIKQENIKQENIKQENIKQENIKQENIDDDYFNFIINY